MRGAGGGKSGLTNSVRIGVGRSRLNAGNTWVTDATEPLSKTWGCSGRGENLRWSKENQTNGKDLAEAVPAGVPANIDVDQYPSLVALLEDSLKKYASLPAYKFMGGRSASRSSTRLRARSPPTCNRSAAKGDRVAIMLPNIPQYPVAVAAVLRAGYVVVNVNPLYTPRELEHQLKDSGAKAILIVENFAHAAAGDRRGADQEGHPHRAGRHAGFPWKVADRQPRGAQGEEDGAGLASCPAPCASTTRSRAAARPSRPPRWGPDDIAVLQYTGGTTGVSKGAVLLHRNLVANILQVEAWYQPALKKIPRASRSSPSARCRSTTSSASTRT